MNGSVGIDGIDYSQLSAENVNIPPQSTIYWSGGWALGWRAWVNHLKPDDVEGARRLLAMGLKPQNLLNSAFTLPFPWKVLFRPLLFRVLVDAGLVNTFPLSAWEYMTLGHEVQPEEYENLKKTVRILFEHGLLDPRPGHPVYEQMIPVLRGVCDRRQRCRAATIALCGVRKRHPADRDVLGLIIQMVWSSRYSDDWN